VNARLANGDRVNAVADSVAIGGPVVTIRRFSNRITSLDTLVELGSLPAWYAQLLRWAVRTRRGIAVAGGTGSGKTTLLNALSCEIDPGERIVTIEDSAELRFDAHPDVVSLEARGASIEGSGEVTIRDLVKNSLRMRPDRIVVGEVRGEECVDMLAAMTTGHDGSMTTLHAGTAEEAVLRLVLMARFGMDLPADIIEEQIASALDLIVMSRRSPDGMRFITSTHEVGWSREEKAVDLGECVSFDVAERTWALVREPEFVGQGVSDGILDEGEVEQWRSSCR
jgi:pilus assembly protein CpaF